MARIAKIYCPNCPRELQIRAEHVGRRVSCKYCEFRFRVPDHVMIPCPSCGQEGRVRTEHLGLKIRCKECGHVARARMKPTWTAPRVDVTPGAYSEVERLREELARRNAEYEEILRQLEEARETLFSLDQRARTLTDARDTAQVTQEWLVPEEESPEPEFGTEPDLPLADLDDEPCSLDDEPPTERRAIDEEDFRLSKTRFAGRPASGDEVEALREERDRLLAELTELRDKSDRTVVTTDGPEAVERELQIARADNVRLAAEREEVARAADGLVKLLRERDAALGELLRDRDALRVERDNAVVDRLTLTSELERLRRELGDTALPLADGAEFVLDEARAEIERLRLAAVAEATRRDEAEARIQSLRDEISLLRESAPGDEVFSLRDARDAALARVAEIEPRLVELADRLAAVEAERDEAARRAHPFDIQREATALVPILQDRCSAAEAERDDLARRLARMESAHDELTQRLSILDAEPSELADRLGRAESERDDLARRIAQAESARAEFAERLPRAESERDELTERWGRVQAERDEFAGQLTRLMAQGDELASALQGLQAERSELARRTSESEARRDELAGRLAHAESEREERARVSEAISSERDDLARRLAEAEAARDELTAHRDRAGADRDELAGRLAHAESEREERGRQIETLASERDDLAGRLARIEAERSELAARAAEAETERDALRGELSRSESERNDILNRLNQTESEREDLRNRLAHAGTERDALSARAAETEASRGDLADALARAEAEIDELRVELQEAKDRTALHVSEYGTKIPSQAPGDDSERRLAELTRRLREETERADLAGSKLETLTRELAATQAALHAPSIVGKSPIAPPAPGAAAGRDRIEELIQERDQARRELARLRTMLDYLGTRDPAPG